MHCSVSEIDTIPPNYEAVKLISLSFMATTFEMPKIVALSCMCSFNTRGMGPSSNKYVIFYTSSAHIYVCPLKLDLKGQG